MVARTRLAVPYIVCLVYKRENIDGRITCKATASQWGLNKTLNKIVCGLFHTDTNPVLKSGTCIYSFYLPWIGGWLNMSRYSVTLYQLHALHIFNELCSYYMFADGWANWLGYSLTTDEESFDFRQKRVIFLCSETSRPALKAAKLYIRWEQWAVALGISRPGREDVQTPPPIAKVKNECVCVYLCVWVCMCLCLYIYTYMYIYIYIYTYYLLWAFKARRWATLHFWNGYNEGLERGYVIYEWSSAYRNKIINKNDFTVITTWQFIWKYQKSWNSKLWSMKERTLFNYVRLFYITNEMQLIQCSLLLSALYMFRAVFPPIIRSL